MEPALHTGLSVFSLGAFQYTKYKEGQKKTKPEQNCPQSVGVPLLGAPLAVPRLGVAGPVNKSGVGTPPLAPAPIGSPPGEGIHGHQEVVAC